MLTRESLVAYVRSGCKLRSKWRIGTEHEKFGFYFEDSKRPLDYATIATLLEKISKNFEWDPIMENGRIIGLRQGGQSVTLEPGGQFELSGAPLETIHLTCAEVNSHLYQVRTHKTCTLTEKNSVKDGNRDAPCMRASMDATGIVGRVSRFRAPM